MDLKDALEVCDNIPFTALPQKWIQYIEAFLLGLAMFAAVYVALMLATVIFLKVYQWVHNCRRRRPRATADPENPEDPEDPEDPEAPEAPVAFIGGKVDRHGRSRYAGTRHTAYESEAILLNPSSNTVTIRILPAQSSSTNKGNKKQAKAEARVEIRSETGAEVQAQSSAEAEANLEGQQEARAKAQAKSSTEGQPEVDANNNKQQEVRVEIFADTHEEAETASNSSTVCAECDPLYCSVLSCLCEGSGTSTSRSTPYLPSGFIPSAPFRENQQPRRNSSGNSLNAMLESFGTIATPFSYRYNNSLRYDDIRFGPYARNAKYLHYYK